LAAEKCVVKDDSNTFFTAHFLPLKSNGAVGAGVVSETDEELRQLSIIRSLTEVSLRNGQTLTDSVVRRSTIAQGIWRQKNVW
jgi:hypothetical protein